METIFPFGAITLIITASLDEACPVIVIVVEPSTASASISKPPANATGAYANDATNIRLAKIGNAFLDLILTGRTTKDCVYKQSD